MSISEALSLFIAGTSVLITLILFVAAYKSDVLGLINVVPPNERWTTESELLRDPSADQATLRAFQGSTEPLFQKEHLARYYSQVLGQSKIAFWFSLLFAALGFTVIITAAFVHSNGNLDATIIKGMAGIILDAVAALFFVQSKRAQSAMAQSLDKLRTDWRQAESRTLCESVGDIRAKDAVRVTLALFHAGVDNFEPLAKHIVDNCVWAPPDVDASDAGTNP